MSIALMTEVWNSVLPTATHKLVLLAFADFANDDGACWPSKARVAARSQLSPRQVQRIIADLQQLGVLARLEKESQHATPLYKVRGDKLTPLNPAGETNEHSGETFEDSGETSASPGETNLTSRGDADVSLTVIEPSLGEPSLEPSTNRVDFSFFDEWKRAKGKPHPQDPRRKEATA